MIYSHATNDDQPTEQSRETRDERKRLGLILQQQQQQLSERSYVIDAAIRNEQRSRKKKRKWAERQIIINYTLHCVVCNVQDDETESFLV